VGQLFEALEPQKSGSSLDGMNGAKDFRKQSSVVGPLLEFGETALHAIKAFHALNQKLSRQFIRHVGLSFRLGFGSVRSTLLVLSEEFDGT